MGRAEGKVEDYLRKRVKAEAGQARKLRWIGRRGAPDELVWFGAPLRQALFECKSEDGELSKLQRREIDRMRDDGWLVFVVSTHEEVDAAIRAVKEGLAI